MDSRNSAIRPASVRDVPQIVALSEQKRVEYQQHQPIFWRKAEDSVARQTTYLENLIGNGNAIALVCETPTGVCGFAVAAVVAAPPVYDPGGLTCVIDDYAVEHPNQWQSVGQELLKAIQQEAASRGAVQTVVVCGHRDEAKRTMLASLGFSIASEWYVRSPI